jgi:NAD(P)H-nitrite reductase large subunit
MVASALPDLRGVHPDKIVCGCLRVTAGTLMGALEAGSVRTLGDVKRETGAGDGCMVCHRVLRRYLDQNAN